MSETQEDTPNNQDNPELDELMANMEKMNDGLSGLMVSALRMQMLILEDTQNMMAEFGAMSAAAGARDANKGDI
jgi:hypothetical protein